MSNRQPYTVSGVVGRPYYVMRGPVRVAGPFKNHAEALQEQARLVAGGVRQETPVR